VIAAFEDDRVTTLSWKVGGKPSRVVVYQ
jgi:hypothetical protein